MPRPWPVVRGSSRSTHGSGGARDPSPRGRFAARDGRPGPMPSGLLPGLHPDPARGLAPRGGRSIDFATRGTKRRRAAEARRGTGRTRPRAVARSDCDPSRHEYHHPAAGWGAARSVGRVWHARPSRWTGSARCSSDEPRGRRLRLPRLRVARRPQGPAARHLRERHQARHVGDDAASASTATSSPPTRSPSSSEWTRLRARGPGTADEPMVYDAGDATATCRSPGRTPSSWSARRCAALDSPHQASFYTSGRLGNEATFLYQLWVREFGTNNLPDCSNMCHEASGRALTASLGTGKGTVDLERLGAGRRLIFVMGANAASNAPRMLTSLAEADRAARRSCTSTRWSRRPRAHDRPARLPRHGDVPCHADRHPQPAAAHRRRPGAAPRHGQGGARGAPRPTRAPRPRSSSSAHRRLRRLPALVRRDRLGRAGAPVGRRRGGDPQGSPSATARRPRRSSAGASASPSTSTASTRSARSSTCCCCAATSAARAPARRPCAGTATSRATAPAASTTARPREFLDRLGEVCGIDPPREARARHRRHDRGDARGDVKVFVGMGGNFALAAPDTGATLRGAPRLRADGAGQHQAQPQPPRPRPQALILPCLGRTEKDHQRSGEQGMTRRGLDEHGAPLPRDEGARPRRTCAPSPRSSPAWPGRRCPEHDAVGGLRRGLRPDPRHDGQGARRLRGLQPPVRLPLGFRIHAAGARAGLPSRRPAARSSRSAPLPDVVPPDGRLTLSTMRSHDQWNTTIYSDDDRYRGVKNLRTILFMNEDDMRERGSSEFDLVDITSIAKDGSTRTVHGYRAVRLRHPARQRRGLHARAERRSAGSATTARRATSR